MSTNRTIAGVLGAVALVVAASTTGVLGTSLGSLSRQVTGPSSASSSASPASSPDASPTTRHRGHVDRAALTVLAHLQTGTLADDGTYKRTADFGGWAYLTGDGCNTRDRILARDLTDVVRRDRCTITSGTLADPYSGQSMAYSIAHASAVQIDHVYPLHRAWEMGAEQWTQAQRVAFANDPANLLAVDGPANDAKGDSGPGVWLPANTRFDCTYAHDYVTVAAKYALPVTTDDRTALTTALHSC